MFIRLREVRLSAKLTKCNFFKKEIIYLGHQIDGNGMKPDPAKIKAIDAIKEPTNLTELRRFLGMTGYYRRYIKRYSKIAKPLTQLLKKANIWKWDQNCQGAFEMLKQRLKEEPILAYPDFTLPFKIHTDASDYGIAAILVQDQGGKRK